MLSRVAERTYWLARYLERAENSARLVNVYSALLLDLPEAAGLDWNVVLKISGSAEEFHAAGYGTGERDILKFILHDEDNPGSLQSSLDSARENARTTRDIVPSEGWRAVNELCMFARTKLPKATAPRQRAQIMAEIIERVHAISGLMAGTMSKGQPYQFTRLGCNLERAEMTTRMIDVAAATLLTGRPELQRYDNTLWMTVLRSLSGYQMYRQYVRRRVHGPDVIRFLLNDNDFPRAVDHCIDQIAEALEKLPRATRPLERTLQLRNQLAEMTAEELGSRAIHQLVDELQLEIAGISDVITTTWFYHGDGR